jgi:predicted exporter
MVGLVVAATVTRWVLPAFLPADFRIRDVTPHGEVLQGLIERTRPLRWGIVVFLGVAAVVLWVRREVLWNEDLGALSPVPVHDLELDATMRADLGAPDVRHVVVVQAPDRESALIAAEQVSARLAALVGDGVLGGFQSPSLYLPSIRTQLARRESLPADGELRRRFAAAAKTLPLRPDRFEPFFADVRVARESRPLQLEDLEGTSFGVVTRSLLQERAGRWTAVLLLTPPRRGPNPGTIDIAKVNHALAPPPVGDKVLLDLKEESDRLYRDYLQEAIRLSLGGVVAIALVLVVALRSPTRVLRTSLPLFSSLILVTATVVLCGRQLTMLHLIGMMLTVAIGSNYCLFFDRLRYRDDSNPIPAPRMLVSLTLANLTTVSVFGLLALSEVPVLNAIGSMVAPGTFLALLVSAWFVPLRSDADRVVEVGR